MVRGIALLAVALWACAPEDSTPSFPVPRIDVTGVEPQVAHKLESERAAVVRDPGSAEAWGKLGRTLHAHSMETAAVECYWVARELSAEARWAYLAALALQETDAAAAMELFEEARASGIEHAAARLAYGATLLEAGERERAEVEFEAARRVPEAEPYACLALARLRVLDGELEAARAQLERALEIDATLGEAHSLASQVYGRLGDDTASNRHAILAERYPDTKAPPDPLFERVVEEGASYGWYYRRGKYALLYGDLAKAERELRRATELQPDNALAWYNLGLALDRAGRMEKGEEAYRRSLSIEEDDARVRTSLGALLARTGATEEAELHLRRAVAIEADSVTALTNLGLLLGNTDRASEAIEPLEAALEASPNAPEPFNRLGTAYARSGRPRDAGRVWRRSVALDPRQEAVWMNLGAAASARGDAVDAIGALRDGVAANPESLRLQAGLSWRLSTTPSAALRNGAEALRLAENVVARGGQRPESLDLLGAALAEVGRFPDAAGLAERAIALARSQGRADLAGQIEERLALYREGRPYRAQP